jgi:hypothetical protein
VNLLLLVLFSFPGQRVANLPTGVLPEPRVWQVNISHRFLPATFAPDWGKDPLRAFTGANVRVTLEKSLGERWVVGIADAISSRVLGLNAAYALLPWLTVYPELNTHLYGFKLDSTWFNLGLCCHRSFGEKLAVMAQPRYTTNTNEHFFSLGLGAKWQVIETWSVGLEAEPVLFGRDSTTRQLAAGLAIEKEIGWHNFIITFGTPREQTAPGLFRSAGEPTAYSDVLDLFRGHFRVGFNLLRKI